MAEDRKRVRRADDASEKASCPQSIPKWGLTVYRIRFTLHNIYSCVSNEYHVNREEAEACAERLMLEMGGQVSLVRVTAERDLVYA